MELRQLEYFVAVARYGQFTKAAASVHLSQPALSIQVGKLERELGLPLFDRVGRSTRLTEAGFLFLDHARRVLSEIEEARSRLNDLGRMECGSLTIGSVPSVSAYWMPGLLAEFRRRHPAVELRLRARRSGEVLQAVLEGEVDLGVEFLPCVERDVTVTPLFSERHVLAVPIGHPFCRRRRIRFEQLHETPLVLLPLDHRIRQSIEAAAEQAGIRLNVSIEVNTIAELHSLAGQGMGLALLPKPYVEDLEKRGRVRVVEIVSPKIVLSVGVAILERRYLSKSAQAFLKLLVTESRVFISPKSTQGG